MHVKLIVDILMIIGMFFSMSFHLLGVGTHKLIGLLAFLLFIVHNLLNRKWFKALFKGKYNSMRTLHTITNIITVLAMLGIMASGVMLSKEMAAGFGDGMTMGRILHNTCSYVCCVGIALHIGFHLKRRKNHDDR